MTLNYSSLAEKHVSDIKLFVLCTKNNIVACLHEIRAFRKKRLIVFICRLRGFINS